MASECKKEVRLRERERIKRIEREKRCKKGMQAAAAAAAAAALAPPHQEPTAAAAVVRTACQQLLCESVMIERKKASEEEAGARDRNRCPVRLIFSFSCFFLLSFMQASERANKHTHRLRERERQAFTSTHCVTDLLSLSHSLSYSSCIQRTKREEETRQPTDGSYFRFLSFTH